MSDIGPDEPNGAVESDLDIAIRLHSTSSSESEDGKLDTYLRQETQIADTSNDDGTLAFEQSRNSDDSGIAEKNTNVEGDYDDEPSLEQIAESNGDMIFEIDDDENDSLGDPFSLPWHNSLPDIEAPDPSEIIQGTADQDEDKEGVTRPKLWATALAVSAVIGLGAVNVLNNSGDLDDIADFDSSFTSSDGGGFLKAGGEGGTAKAGGDGGAAKIGADSATTKLGDSAVGAKASDSAAYAKAGDTAVGRVGDSANTGCGGPTGNDAGATAGRAASSNDGGGGARPRTQQ